MLSIICMLVLAGFIGTIVSALGKCPLWVPVLFLAIAELAHCIPLR